jgi:hypothetical protein
MTMRLKAKESRGKRRLRSIDFSDNPLQVKTFK